MIQLPENFLDSAYVDNVKGVIFLHFKNKADQYFTYRYFLDKAFSFEQHLQQLETTDFSDQKAYRLNRDLGMVFIEQPNDQDWVPAPLPGDNMLSFPQYKAHANLAANEDRKEKAKSDSR